MEGGQRMKSDGETPSKFWRPQDVWIAGRNNFGVRNPGQLNRSWREPEPSKLSYLGDSEDPRVPEEATTHLAQYRAIGPLRIPEDPRVPEEATTHLARGRFHCPFLYGTSLV